MLWQGAPRWTALAVRAFHVRKVAIYFAVLVVWRIAAEWSSAASAAVLFQSVIWLLVLAAGAIGALALLAWAMARTSIYTITNRRVVMRIGVALQMMMNLPFKQVRSAGLKVYADGTGDIPLKLAESARTSYVLFWPHARPWTFSPSQPMLRCIPEAQRVAGILADALDAYARHGEAGDGAADGIPAGVTSAQPEPAVPTPIGVEPSATTFATSEAGNPSASDHPSS